MTKIEFLAAVSVELGGLRPADVREQIGFLSEMIDDRIDEGFSEAEAVSAMGAPASVAATILADAPFSAIVDDGKGKEKKHGSFRTVLIWAASPIWVSLVFAAVIALFCVTVTLLSLALGFGIAVVPLYLIYKGSWLGGKYLFLGSVAGCKRFFGFLFG